MKKILFVLCGLVLVVTIVGCGGTRMYTTTKERVDTYVSGNQGVVYGPVPAPHKVAVPARDIVAVDVELPTMSEAHEALKANPQPPAQSTVAQPPPAKVEKIK